jgi:predicted TIM-barrel fold metal-dependent hydrolase
VTQPQNYSRIMTITEERPGTGEGPGKNDWRLTSPGHSGWTRTARPGDPNKYFMVSADTHASEPKDFLQHLEPEYLARAPRVETRENGSMWLVCEGSKPMLVRGPAKAEGAPVATGGRAEFTSPMDDEDLMRSKAALTVEMRLADQARDGVDAEIVYPNRGLLCFATPDPVFAAAMCRAYNRWALDYFAGHEDQVVAPALVAAGDLNAALAEIEWAAANGHRAVLLGNKPLWGPTLTDDLGYNDPAFDRMWAALQDADLAVCLHVSTGRDPRASGGNGGALINYVCHSMATTMEPIVQMITSGVFERFPGLRAGTVESGIGWIPWLLETLDYAYRAHHFWIRPIIPELPSTYYRNNCFSTFQEDHEGLERVEALDLVDNYLWANDYPHHEGSWPHSAESIERSMGHVSDESRAKILGLNAARLFRIPVPAGEGR